MSPAAPGITALSASQAEEFDPEQVGGCPRRWFMHRVERVPLPKPERSKVDGDFGHRHFAHYYRTGLRPGRARMAKAVKGAIDAARLPLPEPGMLIESRFDGQPARDATGERVPLRTETTLWLGGVPWDGYVDLRFYRAGTIHIVDHKFSSDIHTYAKHDLLTTVQMPVYALDSLRIWPEAEYVELVHNYVSRRGVDSLYVRQLVTVAQVRQRGEEIAGLVKRMQDAASAPSADDVPANRASCYTWSGCPFQSRCSAFKEKPKMNLNPEELEWLNVVGGGEPATGKEKAERAAVALAGTDPAVLAAAVEGLSETERTALKGVVQKLAVSGPETDDGEPPDLQAQRVEEAARHAAELERAAAPSPAGEDPFAVFAPQASVPQEQPAPLVAAEAPKPADDSPKCPGCPHPAHPGAACTGKRGRGSCKCIGAVSVGAMVENIVQAHVTTALVNGHPPTCVQDDAGKWLCMEGCTAGKVQVEEVVLLGADAAAAAYQAAQASPEGLRDALARERDMHRRTLGELDASERERNAMKKELERLRGLEQRVGGAGLPSATSWTGTLQVNVNLGPETLALLQRLFGAKP
jgi:hypothetical protein